MPAAVAVLPACLRFCLQDDAPCDLAHRVRRAGMQARLLSHHHTALLSCHPSSSFLRQHHTGRCCSGAASGRVLPACPSRFQNHMCCRSHNRHMHPPSCETTPAPSGACRSRPCPQQQQLWFRNNNKILIHKTPATCTTHLLPWAGWHSSLCSNPHID